MNISNQLITVSVDVLGGTPVFKDTRVPVETLFWHLEKGISLDDFLVDFPSVSREQAATVLHEAGRNFAKLFEVAQ